MIDQSNVYKCLEKKTLILGFEFADLFIVCLVLCILNLVFSDTSMKLWLTWGPSIALALGIRLMKTGKAENYLLHFIKYHLSPGVMTAFPLAQGNGLLQLKKKGLRNARFKFE